MFGSTLSVAPALLSSGQVIRAQANRPHGMDHAWDIHLQHVQTRAWASSVQSPALSFLAGSGHWGGVTSLGGTRKHKTLSIEIVLSFARLLMVRKLYDYRFSCSPGFPTFLLFRPPRSFSTSPFSSSGLQVQTLHQGSRQRSAHLQRRSLRPLPCRCPRRPLAATPMLQRSNRS